MMKLMFRWLLVILVVSITNSCKNEIKVENGVVDLRIYDLMNQVLQDNNDQCNLILDSFFGPVQRIIGEYDSSTLAMYNSIFSIEDINYMMQESRRLSDIKLSQKHFDQKIINSDSVYKRLSLKSVKFWKWFREEYHEESFCTVSWPVLSKTNQYALVKYGYVCGSLCGHRVSLIYKYEGECWYFIDKYNESYS